MTSPAPPQSAEGDETKPTACAIDTSVAIALLVLNHSAHAAVADWARGRDLSLLGHAAVETYSVLTRLPGDLRLAASDAITLINANFTLGGTTDAEIVTTLAALDIAGGAVYDGVVAHAALEAGLALATRDARARSVYERVGIDVLLVAG